MEWVKIQASVSRTSAPPKHRQRRADGHHPAAPCRGKTGVDQRRLVRAMKPAGCSTGSWASNRPTTPGAPRCRSTLAPTSSAVYTRPTWVAARTGTHAGAERAARPVPLRLRIAGPHRRIQLAADHRPARTRRCRPRDRAERHRDGHQRAEGGGIDADRKPRVVAFGGRRRRPEPW